MFWKLNVKKVCDIKPAAFNPKPKIDSSLLIFVPRKNFYKLKNQSPLNHINFRKISFQQNDMSEKVSTSFKNCLKQWEHRKLTLLGKVTVIKTSALPKLIFPLTVLKSPNMSF